MKRITIKDIARDLDIHHSTVSRALRDSSSVSPETRKKVNDYARQKGYQINMNALQLRGSLKNVIAVVVPNIYHSFFSNIVSIVADLAFNKGYVVSIYQSNESYKQEKEIIQTLIRNNVAGVVASISMETRESAHYRELSRYRIPLVQFDRVSPDLEVTKVIVNNAEVVTEAVEILIGKGFKRIAHLTGSDHINVFKDRQTGYLNALKKHKLDYQRIISIKEAFTIEEGKKAIQGIFNDSIRPDAIVCDSHLLTLGALYKIQEFNLKVPQDIGVVGFGDNPYINTLNSGIISIIQPDTAIATALFELILKRMDDFENERSTTLTISANIITN